MIENERITALVVEPFKKPYTKEIDAGLASLQREVGGYIQVLYPCKESCALICDDEGKLKNCEPNRALRDEDGHIYDIVAGTFLIVGLSEENFASLSNEYIAKFSALFAAPEVFVRSFDGKIIVIPVEDADYES